MKTHLLATAAIILAGAASADTPSINPGEWETTVTTSVSMTMNGQAMALPGQTASSTECITQEEAELKPEDFEDNGCTVSNFQTTATTASFDMACSQNGADLTGTMSVETGADGETYSGTFEIAGSAQGIGDMIVQGTVNGTRTGTCSE